MAASARALLVSRFISQFDLFRTISLKPPPSLTLPSSSHHHQLSRFSFPAGAKPCRRNLPYPYVYNCIFSSGGESVADDFVSTRKSDLRREFAVLANVLKQIAPLDTSVIAKGVSEPAKDSMKRTISTMLGLLPSDQFAVSIRVSREPLQRLLSSSIITGYTLWNAEYRVSLMRNFDNSPENEEVDSVNYGGPLLAKSEDSTGESEMKGRNFEDDDEKMVPHFLNDLSPEALSYIEDLKSDLASIEKKLNLQKLENMQLECNRERSNDLLEYLRSLEPEMVVELCQPSSSEVTDIIQQLVQNVLHEFFDGETSAAFFEEPVIEEILNFQNDGGESCAAIRTSRDYLAKLLFWCMLLGHHMRGLECRLHLSCVVGLL